MEEETQTMKKNTNNNSSNKHHPSIPSVTILDLKERWLKQQAQKQKAQDPREEKLSIKQPPPLEEYQPQNPEKEINGSQENNNLVKKKKWNKKKKNDKNRKPKQHEEANGVVGDDDRTVKTEKKLEAISVENGRRRREGSNKDEVGIRVSRRNDGVGGRKSDDYGRFGGGYGRNGHGKNMVWVKKGESSSNGGSVEYKGD